MDIEEVPPSNESEEKWPPPGQRRLLAASPFLAAEPHRAYNIFASAAHHIGAHKPDGLERLDELTAPGFFAEHFIGLENFKNILTTPEFWNVLWNTLRYIIMYIPLMLAASIAVATLLSRQRRGVTAFRIIYYIPVLTSWVAASLIWKSVLSPQYGALNGILGFFGIEGPGWLLDENWAMPGHRARLRVEGHGLFRSYTALRHDRHKPKLL